MKKTLLTIGMILILLGGWVFSAGLALVPAQTVQVVRYPEYSGSMLIFEKPMPVQNDTDSPKLYFTWPRIPRTDIGVKEENYSLKEPVEASVKTKLFNLYYVTENPADKDKIAYLSVSGSFEVTDWKNFLLTFDPKKLGDSQKNRSEILISKAGDFIFSSNIGGWFSESVSRTFLAKKVIEQYGLKTEEEAEYFIKVYRPWYWALGVLYFYQLDEEIRRNPFPSLFAIDMIARVTYAAGVETEISNVNWRLKLLAEQKKAFYKDLDPAALKEAESIVKDFKVYLKAREERWPIYYEPEKQLSDFLIKSQMAGKSYGPQALYAARYLVATESEIDRLIEDREYLNQQAAQAYEFFKGLRLWESKGNDSLWKYAIKRAVQEKLLYDNKSFYSWLKTDGMDYLREEFEREKELLERQSGVRFISLIFKIEEIIEAPVK